MCGEFYPGWFDTWGAPHHTGNTERYLDDLEYMLKNRQSFSIYMAHGGTTFGFWHGCRSAVQTRHFELRLRRAHQRSRLADGQVFETRELFARYLNPGETIPEPPAQQPVIAIDPVKAIEAAPLLANLPQPAADEQPLTFEQYDQAYGCILYRTQIPAGQPATLSAKLVHDIG